jgi:hypothetical protein
MRCILFCVNPKIADMSDAIAHLKTPHEKLYFEVKFPIAESDFPLIGFVHISGDRVRYAVHIEDILPFSREHYEAPGADAFKPQKWLEEWINNANDVQSERWKHALVITAIVPFEHETLSLRKRDGQLVHHPPQNYIKILPPNGWSGFRL